MTSGDVMPHKFRLPAPRTKYLGRFMVQPALDLLPLEKWWTLAQKNKKRFTIEPALDPTTGNWFQYDFKTEP